MTQANVQASSQAPPIVRASQPEIDAANRPPRDPTFLQVFTLVVWLTCVAVGLLGLWLQAQSLGPKYQPPPPPEPPPVQAEQAGGICQGVLLFFQRIFMAPDQTKYMFSGDGTTGKIFCYEFKGLYDTSNAIGTDGARRSPADTETTKNAFRNANDGVTTVCLIVH